MIGTLLSIIAAAYATLMLLRPSDGTVRGILWLPKVLAEAVTLPATIMAALGAGLSLCRQRWFEAALSLSGAAIGVTHVLEVAAPNDDFAKAFGADWENRIPEKLRPKLLKRRLSLILHCLPEESWKRDVVIGTHHETDEPLLADLWYPPSDVPQSGLGIIFLHGSGWHYGDKDMRTRPLFRRLAWQGHCIADVAYTLAPGANVFEMLADVKRAITWMKTRGVDHGVNPDRIVLMGGSAGGHLALLAGYTPNHEQLDPPDADVDTGVRGVISYYGLADLEATYRHFKENFQNYLGENTRIGRAIIPWWERQSQQTRLLGESAHLVLPADLVPSVMGGTAEELPDLYRLGSPIHHVDSDCPPTLLVQGAHDFAGMAPQVRQLHATLKNAGVSSVLLELPHTEHGFDLLSPRLSPATRAAIYDTERFLALLL